MINRLALSAAFLAVLAIQTGNAHSQETIKTRIGDLSFTHDFANGYPTTETQQKLLDEIDFQRTCQTYLWAIPTIEMSQWR